MERGWGMGKGPEAPRVERGWGMGKGLEAPRVERGWGMGKGLEAPRVERGNAGMGKGPRGSPGGEGGWAKASRIDPASSERARLPTVPRSEGRGIDSASRERGRLATAL